MSDPNAEQEPSMEEILASIRRIISEDGEEDTAEQPEPEPEPEPPAGHEEGVLELTDEVQDDGTVVNLKTGEEVSEEPVEEEDVGLEMIDAEGKPGAEPVIGAAAEAVAAERLVSDIPGMESVSALSGLAAAVNNHRRAVDPSIGARTIEDLVKEVMRPMIREWLDDNLPALVERLVSREIERLTREAEEISQR